MKRIILLLALLSLGVSKAQVVGGYLPLNSTKSFTAGNSTFSNVIARGTLSVGSTATVSGNALFSSSVGIGSLPTSSLSAFRVVKGTGTVDIGEQSAGVGAIWFNQSTPNATNFSFLNSGGISAVNGTAAVDLRVGGNNSLRLTDTYLTASYKTRIGSTTIPTATLDVTGTGSISSTFTVGGALTAQSTMSLGSANLTGGNTGTVAVLSDAVFSFFLFATVTNPADATTYYFGNNGYQLSTTSSGSVTVPYNATLIGYDWSAVTSGAAGTTEASTLSINGTTNYTLSTSISFSTAYTNSSSMGLSQDFNANDKVNIKILTPTFATNPTAVYQGITLYFRRRS